MPELPEVHTTVTELQKLVPGLSIIDVWSGYDSSAFKEKDQIKNVTFFKEFKKKITGETITNVHRRAKNVLIDLSNGYTILVHMKMTGHLLYGTYIDQNTTKNPKKAHWISVTEGPLQDKWNGWIRLVFTLSNGKHLALSDLRKFAKVTLLETKTLDQSADLKDIGPEAPTLTLKQFEEQILKRPNGRIKNVLMDQTLIAGIGNIYSDEALWLSHIHPERSPQSLKQIEIKNILKNIKKVLKRGIDFKGDSTSDYRTPSGEPGAFQHHHKVYRQTKKPCETKDCNGIIERKVLGGRSAHFCPKCQK